MDLWSVMLKLEEHCLWVWILFHFFFFTGLHSRTVTEFFKKGKINASLNTRLVGSHIRKLDFILFLMYMLWWLKNSCLLKDMYMLVHISILLSETSLREQKKYSILQSKKMSNFSLLPIFLVDLSRFSTKVKWENGHWLSKWFSCGFSCSVPPAQKYKAAQIGSLGTK